MSASAGPSSTPDPLARAGAAAIELALSWERFWEAVRTLEARNREARDPDEDALDVAEFRKMQEQQAFEKGSQP